MTCKRYPVFALLDLLFVIASARFKDHCTRSIFEPLESHILHLNVLVNRNKYNAFCRFHVVLSSETLWRRFCVPPSIFRATALLEQSSIQYLLHPNLKRFLLVGFRLPFRLPKQYPRQDGDCNLCYPVMNCFSACYLSSMSR